MSGYERKAARKKQLEEKGKGPRCCGRHMQLTNTGLWRCRKCGRMRGWGKPAADSEAMIETVSMSDSVEALEEVEVVTSENTGE